MLNPVSSFSRESVPLNLMAYLQDNRSQIAAVGLGALGSQVFMSI